MTSCSILYNLTESRKWWDVIARCKSSPSEAAYEDRYSLCNVLHKACDRGAPVKAVQALLEAISNVEKNPSISIGQNNSLSSTAILCQRDQNGETPLMCAIKVEANEDIVLTLLRAHPQAASIPDRNGWFPVHVAFRKGYSVDTLVDLMEADPNALMRHSFTLHYWDWYITTNLSGLNNGKNDFSRNCVDQNIFWQHLGADFQGFWTKMAILANVAHYKYLRRTICTNPFDEILHAVVGQARYTLPREFVTLVMRLHLTMAGSKDRDGNYPLHVISATRPSQQTVEEDLRIIQNLLLAFPDATKMKNKKGRYPLSLMIENGRCWNNGVELLFKTDPDVIVRKDNGLYPFMLAANSKSASSRSDNICSINLIYELVRHSPEQIEWSTQSFSIEPQNMTLD
jgi:hypothetical protein